MGRISPTLKTALAVLAAVVIVAVPHLLTVDRGLSEVVTVGDVHPCPPLPNAATYRIFVRNISCEDGTAIAGEVLSMPGCRQGFCDAREDFSCNRTERDQGRLFWLCRIAGGGAKVRFVIAKGA